VEHNDLEEGERMPPPTARPHGWILAPLALSAALIVAGCTAASTPAPAASSTSSATGTGAAAPAPAAPSGDIPALVKQVEPSVVTVLTQKGLGSGVVYKTDGTIVTDAHVVAGATQVKVAFADGQQVSATVRAADSISDVAVLQADRKNLPAASFETTLPPVGALDVVLGSPLGFENTVTAGIISGLHRDLPGSAATGAPLVNLMQTDAPISPGNSGGAVIDGQGRVVGLSEAYIPPSAGAVALGFATPAATVVGIADQLLATGTAQHAYVGIQPATLTPQIAQQLGLKQSTGVVVLQVQPSSPAASAGLQPGDVITAFNGQNTSSAEDFVGKLRTVKPGDQITLTVARGVGTQQITVTVADRPPS
jgi:serine protease DegQ